VATVSAATSVEVWHVSDPHLGRYSPRGADGRHGWDVLVDEVKRRRPSVVVITGDLVADDPDDPDEQEFAQRQVGRLVTRVLVVPGNHDVGDQEPRPGLPADWVGTPITTERRRRWTRRWGPDRWCEELADWRLVGLDSQLLGSGLPDEKCQQHWLADVGARSADRDVLLFSHQALDATTLGLPAHSWAAVPPPHGALVRDAFADARLQVVAHGHVHRHHDTTADGVRHLSAPSLSGPIPDRADMTTPAGTALRGWLELRLGAADLTVTVTAVSARTDRPTTRHSTSPPTERTAVLGA